MPTLAEQLAQAASALSITGVPTTAQPGQLVAAALIPPLGPLQFTDFVNTPIGLDLIAKDVVFSNADITSPTFVEDPALRKIKPLFNFLTVPPTTDPSGVGGLIGKIQGTIPLPVSVEAIPSLTVTWRVQDDAGNDLVEGTDFLAPSGLTSTTLQVVFLPAFAIFDGSVPPPTVRQILADVTVTAGPETAAVTVGPVPVSIPTIPFPRVLALTLYTNFNGAALVMVPGSSAITTVNQVKSLLQPVRNVISTLTTIARFAEMLLGIDTLAHVLDASNIAFSRADRVNNLNNIDLITRGFFQNDTEAEDELSAFVYLSPPPPPRSSANAVEMCNDRDLDTGEGKFTVTTSTSFVALCSNLHFATPTVAPSSATLTVNNAPPGGWFNPDTFGDELSSIRFL
ncbi:MAG TPA: hypothetical protein VGQ76_07735 [Thermoanaerobaculia bacterium]|jgi:hypothetical protein|nr:hypothetical protein [Thermoanaerobaculia bacterium]